MTEPNIVKLVKFALEKDAEVVRASIKDNEEAAKALFKKVAEGNLAMLMDCIEHFPPGSFKIPLFTYGGKSWPVTEL